MVPPEPPIFYRIPTKKFLWKDKRIGESGGKKIKNPSDGTNFLLQNDPQDVGPV
jgi:hypothetical protein